MSAMVTDEVRCKRGVEWQDDSSIYSCSGCGSQFGLLLRRHHCRNCGKIFCYGCSSARCVVSDVSKSIPQRVCKWCKLTLVPVGFNRVTFGDEPNAEVGGVGQRTSSMEDPAIQSLLLMNGNNMCVDCGSPKPTWLSVNNGVVFCIECAGHHRGLGIRTSYVRSIELDEIKLEEIEGLKHSGNSKFNNFLNKFDIELALILQGDRTIKKNRNIISRKYDCPTAQVYRDLLKQKLSNPSTVVSEKNIFVLIKEKMASSGAAAEEKIKRPPKAVKPKWADDGPTCFQCNSIFGATLRRHHCRMCGDLVCANCAPNERPILEFGYKEAVRVCLKCFNPPKPSTKTMR